MKFLQPSYYNDFHCIGNECKQNCCETPWKIKIDTKSMEKYQQVNGEFGQKLNHSISKENSAFILNDGVCPFLNDDKLCDIYINCGEDYLCNTCKTYPRITFFYGDLCEKSLVLSCPEVARILVSHKEPIEFDFGTDNLEFEVETIDYDLYNLLIEARGLSVNIMQMRELPLWKRQFWILYIANKLQKSIDKNKFDDTKDLLEKFYDKQYLSNNIINLDSYHKNYSDKLELLLDFMTLKTKETKKFMLKEFEENLYLVLNYFEGKDLSTIAEVLESQEKLFDIYYKDHEYIYENYFVYYLFRYYMKALDNKDLYKYIVILFMGYSVMKLFALIKWINNKQILTDDEQIDIMYSYSRSFEHNTKTYGTFYNKMEKQGFSSIEYLINLILCN